MRKLPKINLTQKPTYQKLAEDIDFLSLFQVIESHYENCFIFESLGEAEMLSRYSVIGFDPQTIISAKKTTLTFTNKTSVETFTVANPYESLREIVPHDVISRRYAGGLVGYLSYDAVNYFESSIDVAVHDAFDQFKFGVYTDGLVYDKMTGEVLYFFYEQNRMKTVEKFLKDKSKPIEKKKLQITLRGDSLTKEQHAEIVSSVKEEIVKGNIFQCEVGFKTEYTISGDPMPIYEKLREINPSPFMYYLKFAEQIIIGASPELIFDLHNDEMTTVPLAGTIRRGKTAKEDQQLVRKLLNDPKEIAEHSMLVDLHRNDMGRVAAFGTVKVRDLMTVKKFSHVQHIASEVVGIKRPDIDMYQALAANFPMGTVTGAPKIEAMKIIDRNEKAARGPYGGGVGHFGFNGDCTFAVTLRNLFISGTYAYTQTCGGIVFDSEPEKEYQEIVNKREAMRRVLV